MSIVGDWSVGMEDVNGKTKMAVIHEIYLRTKEVKWNGDNWKLEGVTIHAAFSYRHITRKPRYAGCQASLQSGRVHGYMMWMKFMQPRGELNVCTGDQAIWNLGSSLVIFLHLRQLIPVARRFVHVYITYFTQMYFFHGKDLRSIWELGGLGDSNCSMHVH